MMHKGTISFPNDTLLYLLTHVGRFTLADYDVEYSFIFMTKSQILVVHILPSLRCHVQLIKL